jgi:hypothetical protein
MRRLAMLLLAVQACFGFASAAGPVPDYQTRTIEGWTVQIDERLLATSKDATDQAVVVLTAQLKEIVRLVPTAAVAQLRKVTLWFSPSYPGTEPNAAYHPNVAWLRAHGRNPAMAKGVEFTNIPFFETETRRMPMFVLHELAHAYHDQVLGYEDAEVIDAYTRAKASKSYDRVERWHGPGRPNTFEMAYAMRNVQEYFAETTEALFGRNDFYPFTRDELAKHDPHMSALLQRLWQVTAPLPALAPIPAPIASAFDTRCFYRLTTLWQGDGLSLDIRNGGEANNAPILAKTGNYSGQLWRLTPDSSGAWRLTTQWRGIGFSLASAANNRIHLVQTAAGPEQLWRLKPEANGLYRLTTQAQGDGMSLDILNDGETNNTPIFARRGNYSGQMWKLALVSPCP